MYRLNTGSISFGLCKKFWRVSVIWILFVTFLYDHDSVVHNPIICLIFASPYSSLWGNRIRCAFELQLQMYI